ncbi:MAG TPA: serine--tRNA ligase [Candidatus Paceibacterota bacterium]|nr:serine--tRNA ligase [Candidatus Paceibacterota bacterium]
MLDIKFIRENPDLIKAAVVKKHLDLDVDELLATEARRTALLLEVEGMRAEQNAATDAIAKASPESRGEMIATMKALKDRLSLKEEELKSVMEVWRNLMLRVPNVPDVSVPEGDSDAQNLEVRKWGEPRTFDFEPKHHVDLMLAHDMADLDRGAKVAGFRGYFLKNDGALLSWAIWQYALDHFVKKGWTPLIVPSMVRREAFLGTGYLPQGEEDLYRTQDGDFLAGTAEVATMAYFQDEILDKSAFPMKFIAFSPCFRREAGAHGKDTRGLIRVHEFFKLEQVVLSEANHETSVALHEELTKNSEELLQGLNIPYHVVVNCGGDLGLGQVKKYDIEAWVPAEQTYRETHSSSYFHDFQTRRLNIRYRDDDGKLRFVHSLNNTAVASPRILVSIIENYQNADGTITVPEPLQKYLGKSVIGG